MWASYSFLLVLAGGAEWASPEQAHPFLSGGEGSLQSVGTEAFWTGLLWQDPLPLGDGENSPGWALVVGPSFQDTCPLLPDMSQYGEGSIRTGGERVMVPLVAHCPRPTPRPVLLDLPSVVERNEPTQTTFCCLGWGPGSPSSVEPGVLRCPAAMLFVQFLKSVFFRFQSSVATVWSSKVYIVHLAGSNMKKWICAIIWPKILS